MNHVMLDLETFGTRPGCVIRSVGAVQFDPDSGRLGNEFYCNVDEKSCARLKMHKDPETVKWWADEKKAEANKQLLIDPLPIGEVLKRFVNFFEDTRAKFVWSQGSNFDEPLIGAAFYLTKIKTPWKFWDTRDTRTAYDLARFNYHTVQRAGTYHNALDDAKHQVLCVATAYARLRGKML